MLQQVARLPLGGTTLISPYDKDTNSDAMIQAINIINFKAEEIIALPKKRLKWKH